MKKTLRVGVVGHGVMGRTHAHAYRAMPYYYDDVPVRATLAGIATRNPERQEQALRDWGYEFATADYRELCAREDIDIIHCCTPNNLHKEVCLAALEHGKHVYMDKPIATNLADAVLMAQAARAHPECITQVTFQYRFIPALLRAKQILDEGRLGRLFSGRVAYLHAGYVDPNRPFAWRLDPEQSGAGGALFDLGSHVIDLTRHLLGEISSVFHTSEIFIHERPLPGQSEIKKPVTVDDLSLLTARLENGALVTVESSRIATGVQDEIRFEAHGDRGALRFNMMQPNYLEFYDNTAPGEPYGGEKGFKCIETVGRYPKPASLPGPKNSIGWERYHVHAIYRFLECVAQGKPAQPDMEAGMRTQAVLETALESSKKQQWLPVVYPELSWHPTNR